MTGRLGFVPFVWGRPKGGLKQQMGGGSKK